MPPLVRWLPFPFLLLLAACSAGPRVPTEVAIQGPENPMPSPGETVVLDALVTVDGEPTAGDFTYQWLRDGEALPGARGPSLALAPVAKGDAGSYAVRVEAAGAVLLSAPYELEPLDDVWTVTRDADAGPGSLRDAMARAGALDGLAGIRFLLPPAPVRVIHLQSDLPPVTGRLCILGPSDHPLEVDGGGLHRPFAVDGGLLILDNFAVVNGLAQGGSSEGGGGGAGMGGGLFINRGDVTLRHMSFRACRALGGSSSPGTDGERGGGGGFGGDAPSGGDGAGGGWLRGLGGTGHLDGTATTDAGGGPATDGDGAGGGAARGGLPTQPLANWADNLPGGSGTFGGGGGFSVGPLGGGGDGATFGGGGGSGGSAQGLFLPGSAGGAGGVFGGDGGLGDGVTGGRGGGGAGLGGAVCLREGSLRLAVCTFRACQARGGAGGQGGLGKGGAVFVKPFVEGAPFNLGMLRAQAYEGNLATDVVEDAAFDNDDFYVAQTQLLLRIGSPFDLLYRRYRLDRRLGLVWRRSAP